MSRLIKVLVVLAIIGAVVYFASGYYADRRLRASLDEALQHLPPGYAATYGSVHYDFATGQGHVSDISIKRTVAPIFSFTAATLDVSHPNLSLGDDWTKAAANNATTAPDAALPVASEIVFTNIAAKGDKFDGGTEQAKVEGLRIYPWALTRPGQPSWADAVATMNHQPQTPDDIALILRLEAETMLGFGADHSALTKYHGTVEIPATPATDTAPAMAARTVHYTVESSDSDKVERGVLDGGTITGIKIDSGLDGGGSIDRVHLGHADIRQPAMALLNGAVLSPALGNGSSLDQIEYDGIRIEVTGHPPVSLDGFAIGNIAAADGVMKSGDISIKSLKLAKDLAPDPRAAELFDAVGLKQATLSFSAGYRWDVAAKRLDLHETALKIDELGALTLDGSAGNADPAADGLKAATLVHAKLFYEDHSLASRLMAYGAKQLATDEAGVRDLAIKTVTGGAAAFAGSPEIQQAVKQIVTFIKQPQTLTVTLDPPQPLPFQGISAMAGAPPEAAHALGLKVVANAPH
jgi:hypothetical protein